MHDLVLRRGVPRGELYERCKRKKLISGRRREKRGSATSKEGNARCGLSLLLSACAPNALWDHSETMTTVRETVSRQEKTRLRGRQVRYMRTQNRRRWRRRCRRTSARMTRQACWAASKTKKRQEGVL